MFKIPCKGPRGDYINGVEMKLSATEKKALNFALYLATHDLSVRDALLASYKTARIGNAMPTTYDFGKMLEELYGKTLDTTPMVDRTWTAEDEAKYQVAGGFDPFED